MKFYTKTHKHYCGIDLHTKNLYACILDQEGDGDAQVTRLLLISP